MIERYNDPRQLLQLWKEYSGEVLRERTKGNSAEKKGVQKNAKIKCERFAITKCDGFAETQNQAPSVRMLSDGSLRIVFVKKEEPQ